MDGNTSICFLTNGDMNWASSRLRCYWPAQYLPGSIAQQWHPGGEIPPGYRMYVWLKVADLAGMQLVRDAGALNVLDVCDPLWWWKPELCRQMDALADAVVSATSASAVDYADFCGRDTRTMTIIPDRLELSAYPIRRGTHVAADPMRFIWYGMAQNRIALFAALANLERLAANGINIELTILDNAPEQRAEWSDMFPIAHVRWTLENENRVIANHDIALIPPYPGPWGVLKTNNRRLVAWACGLPYTKGIDYRETFDLATSAAERNRFASMGRDALEGSFDVKQSAGQWAELYAQVVK